MSKKIESAHRKLADALEKHAELASGKKSRRGRIESAAADVKRAATAYAAAVSARTDTESPFSDIADPRLDRPTIASLTAERNAHSRRSAHAPLTATDDRTGRLVAVNGVELWVRGFGSTGVPLVVLVPGAASPSDWWDVELCEAIADGDHHVLRYDLRDTGQSTTRPPGEADYTGDDLVDDLAGIIASAGPAPAHVVGLSLGGGLAQQLAIARPDLVRSLTLLSTSPGGPGSEGLPEMSPELAASFEQEPAPMDWSDRDAVHRRMLTEEELFGGTIPIDPARIRRISDSAFDRSIDLSAGSNHWTVPSASGTREQLGSITAPTLVVHGSEDPLFPPGHGEALAREIPGARLLLIPGLGHQFPPPETWPQLVPALLAHFAEADGAR